MDVVYGDVWLRTDISTVAFHILLDIALLIPILWFIYVY